MKLRLNKTYQKVPVQTQNYGKRNFVMTDTKLYVSEDNLPRNYNTEFIGLLKIERKKYLLE